MSRTKQQCIADAIAKKIMANTRKRYSALHADALEETAIMSQDENLPGYTKQNTEAPKDSLLQPENTSDAHTLGQLTHPAPLAHPTEAK